MKIQRKSLVKEIQAHAPLSLVYKCLILSEPFGKVQPFCNKLYSKPLNDWRNVESFLKLRQMKCQKTIALLHCCKKNCRIDQPIPRVNCQKSIKQINVLDESKTITKEMLQVCENNRKKQYHFDDTTLGKMYKLQDQSAEDYQSYLSKHIDDSQIISNQHSFNLKKLTRLQLFQKLRNINQISQAQRQTSQHLSMQLITEKQEKPQNIEFTLRSTVDPSNTEISPLEISDDKEISTMKSKLRSIIQPNQMSVPHSQQQYSFPYFSKKQLGIKLSQLFMTNQESDNNIQQQNDSKINSLIQNKSSLFTREMKRLRIQTEC